MSVSPGLPTLSPAARDGACAARRWAAFVAFAALAGGGLLLVAGAAGIVAVARAFGVGWPSAAAVAAGWCVAVVLALVMPGVHLQRSVRHLTDALDGGGGAALEHLARHQRAFWRWVGLVTAVFVALGAAVAVLVVLR